MGLACRGLTHCSECGGSLSMNEYGTCSYCKEKEKKKKNIGPNEKNVTVHHVTISTEKLKELIKNHYGWSDYSLKGKIDIVTELAHFENDKELLKFLEYMEEE